MTEEEIKEIICKARFDINQMFQRIDELREDLEKVDESLLKLKKHFCPEKFTIVNVTMKSMTDMLEDAYKGFDLAGGIRRMERPSTYEYEKEDGLAETDKV